MVNLEALKKDKKSENDKFRRSEPLSNRQGRTNLSGMLKMKTLPKNHIQCYMAWFKTVTEVTI